MPRQGTASYGTAAQSGGVNANPYEEQAYNAYAAGARASYDGISYEPEKKKAKTEKDTDLEIQAIVSQARYNVSCDEKVIALAYIDRAVNTATATGQPLAEASVLLEKADILMRFYNEFNIAAECINRAITLLEPEGNNYETMSFARILKFIQLVFQGEYNESQVLFKSIVPQIEGFLDQVPMLRQALKMFSDHFKTN